MRKATVTLHNEPVGSVWEDENGFFFQYSDDYLLQFDCIPISLTLPLRKEKYKSDTILPFFDGLIPEGWLLQIAENHWK
jgi:serine/threonine-protein kinase HipA